MGRIFKAFYDARHEKWRIQYTNPGSSQANAVYNAQGEMLEFATQEDALQHIAEMLEKAGKF